MMKSLLLVAGGVGLALAAMLLRNAAENGPVATGGGAPPAGESARDARADADRLAALESALRSEVEQRTALEARVSSLTDELATLRARSAVASAAPSEERGGNASPASDAVPPPFARGGAFRRDGQSQIDALVTAGFAPDRAAWIERRTSELRMQALQAQYDAQRQGKPFDPGQTFGDGALRSELGDADYERYLKAMGRPTSVGVQNVLASSPAERSGLKPGDEVVAYDGKRVFDMRDLNALTYAGTAGESVSVSVRRDGQTLQLTLPRGPLGITAGGPGFRGR